MEELSPKQIENVARWLFKNDPTWKSFLPGIEFKWETESERVHNNYLTFARALAPALALPVPALFDDLGVVIEQPGWQAHAAAVREIVGEP